MVKIKFKFFRMPLLALTREEGLVLFANEKHMVKPGSKLEEIYEKFKD